jgi:hypothetical protein
MVTFGLVERTRIADSGLRVCQAEVVIPRRQECKEETSLFLQCTSSLPSLEVFLETVVTMVELIRGQEVHDCYWGGVGRGGGRW